MIYHRQGLTQYFISLELNAPAEVYFLLVSKEIRVKTVHLVIYAAFNSQGGPACPKYFLHLLVLALVLFAMVEHTTPGEGISKTIQPPATCTCVFKQLLMMKGQQLGLAGCKVRPRFQ